MKTTLDEIDQFLFDLVRVQPGSPSSIESVKYTIARRVAEAMWPKLLDESVDAEIVKDIHNLLHVKSAPLPMPSEYKLGDKVKIIILRDETIND